MSTYPAPPPPGYPPNHGQGQLAVILREPFGAMGMISPQLTIDGYPAPSRWGPNAFPVTPGRHQVRVASRYLWEYGAAEQVVDVAPGQSVQVHYSPPVITFVKGRIGFTPQPRLGGVGLALVLALCALPLILIVIGLAVTR